MATDDGFLLERRPGFVTAPLSDSISNNWYIYPGISRVFPARPFVFGTVTLGNPVEITHNHRGYISFNLVDRFYNRIIITPLAVELGNIATNVDLTIDVWNAYFSAKNLTNISINNAAGIELNGPQFPLVFNRLTMNKWQVRVLADGEPEINYVITFHFLGLPPISVKITGRRAVPWLFTPDWNDSVNEKLSWLTDVMTSQTGAEQRRSLRLSPRQSFEFSVITDNANRQRFEQTLYKYGGRIFAMPLYCDRQILNAVLPADSSVLPINTVGYEFNIANLIMLQHGNNSELLQITAIYDDRLEVLRPTSRNWPVNTSVYPVKTAYLTDPPSITRLTDSIVRARVRLAVNEHNSYSNDYPFTYYRDKPVIELAADWQEDISAEYQRLTRFIDNKTGLVNIVDTAGRPFVVQRYRWVLHTRAQHDAMRRLFYYLKGRLKPVWLSTQNADFTVVNDVYGTAIDVVENDYTIEPGRTDICIELTGRRREYRRIIDITPLNSGVVRLALDGAILDYRLNQINKISFLTLCRLNSDTISIEHLTDADGIAKITAEFKEVRDELE